MPPEGRHGRLPSGSAKPSGRRHATRDKAADAITSLEKMFGPYPFSSLALTQRPGTDSQGWPGIIFLSSYVYLTPAQRAAAHVSASR